MKAKSQSVFLLCSVGLSLLFFASCGPVVPIPTDTPTNTATLTATSTSYPSDSLTLTAAMEATWAATPGFTPAPFATITLMPGDLGWGEISGKVIDGNTNLPISDALVTCEHFSYTSPYRCHSVIGTTTDGFYSFGSQFFHDTDRIVLSVEARGYAPLRFEQSSFTQPGLHKDLLLFPATPTPFLMCTPPSCPGGVLTCGDPNGCPGGCGTICATSTP